MKLNFTTRYVTPSGRQGANARMLSENARRAIEGANERMLRRAGAWGRGYIRRSMRAGRKRAKWRQNPDGTFARTRSQQRVPSRPGRPPNNHQGRRFGLKWIRFEPRNPKTFIVVGPEYGRTRGAWRSSFDISSHLEKGGPGRIWGLNNQPHTVGQQWIQYHTRLKHGLGPSQGWISAIYPRRPYVEPAVRPTINFVYREYGRTLYRMMHLR